MKPTRLLRLLRKPRFPVPVPPLKRVPQQERRSLSDETKTKLLLVGVVSAKTWG